MAAPPSTTTTSTPRRASDSSGGGRSRRPGYAKKMSGSGSNTRFNNNANANANRNNKHGNNNNNSTTKKSAAKVPAVGLLAVDAKQKRANRKSYRRAKQLEVREMKLICNISYVGFFLGYCVMRWCFIQVGPK